MKDVLGLVSNLRDQKRCKIVLILNDDALENSDKSDFELYNEKVVDESLEFAPDASDCVRIALANEGDVHDRLRNAVLALSISNIRIIKKIERLVLRVEPLVRDFEPSILHQAIQSLTVLGWAVYSDDDAPSLDFLRDKRGRGLFGGWGGREPETEIETNWNAVLDEYGFTMMDELDLVLLQGIQRGFFDEDALAMRANELDNKIKAGQSEAEFRAAWDVYHDSFDNNQAEVVENILSSFYENIQAVSPMNLDGTVIVLKRLGYEQKAREIISLYIDGRADERDFFDLEHYAFGDKVVDSDVRTAFDAKYRSFIDDRPPVEVLLGISKDHSWSPDDIILLSKMSAEDFYALFKETRGTDLRRIVRTSLNFGTIGNADAAMSAIAENAKVALERIGKENQLNRLRVGKFGVEVVD